VYKLQQIAEQARQTRMNAEITVNMIERLAATIPCAHLANAASAHIVTETSRSVETLEK